MNITSQSSDEICGDSPAPHQQNIHGFGLIVHYHICFIIIILSVSIMLVW